MVDLLLNAGGARILPVGNEYQQFQIRHNIRHEKPHLQPSAMSEKASTLVVIAFVKADWCLLSNCCLKKCFVQKELAVNIAEYQV